MAKGKRFELSVKNSIIEATNEHLTCIRPDYSGNSKHSVADIVVVVNIGAPSAKRDVVAYYIELKKRSGAAGKRQIVMSGSSSGQSGLDELRTLVEETPPWATPIVGIKFDHRECIVCNAEKLLDHLTDDAYEYHDAAYHGARLTPSDNISMVKPTLDEWNSTSSGEADHIRLLHGVGVSDYYITEDDDG